MDVDAPPNQEGCNLESLFTLDLRVRWRFPMLPRWRFRAPQSASIRLVGQQSATEKSERPEVPDHKLSPLEKFCLIKETDESCYWCNRTIGSKVTIRGRTRRLKLHWDHVTPEHVGGTSDIANMVPSCHLCNAWKAGNVFATEAEIHAFLESRWLMELAAPIAEKSLPTAPIAVVEVESIVLDVVPIADGEVTIPLIPEPEPMAADPGPQIKRRPWKHGDEVRVVVGLVKGAKGYVAGPSREREGWVRVMLGPQSVPWRFLPEQLSRL